MINIKMKSVNALHQWIFFFPRLWVLLRLIKVIFASHHFPSPNSPRALFLLFLTLFTFHPVSCFLLLFLLSSSLVHDAKLCYGLGPYYKVHRCKGCFHCLPCKSAPSSCFIFHPSFFFIFNFIFPPFPNHSPPFLFVFPHHFSLLIAWCKA